jgi:transcriptional regulator
MSTSHTPHAPSHGKTTVAAIERNERTKQVLELRLKGLTLKECADQLGLSVSGCSKMIRRYMQDNPSQAAEEFREMELEKYDKVEAQLFKKTQRKYIKVNAGQVVMIPVKGADGQVLLERNVNTGQLQPVLEEMVDEGPQNEAIGLLLKLWHRRAMLLGIDAPTLVKVDTPVDPAAGMTQAQIDHAASLWLRTMNARAIDATVVTGRPVSVSSRLESTTSPIRLADDPILRS